MLSNDKLSTGLGDRLYSAYSVVALNLKRSHILSWDTNEITGSEVDISIIDPRVEKLGSVVKG